MRPIRDTEDMVVKFLPGSFMKVYISMSAVSPEL